MAGIIPSRLENHEYIVRVREGQTIRLNPRVNHWYLGFYITTPSDAIVEEETFLKNYTGELSESSDCYVFVSRTTGLSCFVASCGCLLIS
jgi:hypothetical protein